MPHLTIEPIVAASAVVTSLQHLVSRVTKATEAAVISVSRFNTGKSGAESPLKCDAFKSACDSLVKLSCIFHSLARRSWPLCWVTMEGAE